MTPITRQDILAHQAVVPWAAQYQVEQDLLLCRAMVALFDDKFLSSQVAMRGGTLLHKVHLAPAARYSEDIDLVVVGTRPADHIRRAIRRAGAKDAWVIEEPIAAAEVLQPIYESAGDWDKVARKDWEARCMEVYAAMIDRMDQGIGRIVAELKRTGQVTASVPAAGELPEAYRTNMRTITVSLSWTNYNGAKPIRHQREMQTRVSRNGMQNYIWGAL